MKVRDRIFWEEYRTHVGRSIICGCDLISPDDDCDKGSALFRVATRTREETHQEVFLREMMRR